MQPRARVPLGTESSCRGDTGAPLLPGHVQELSTPEARKHLGEGKQNVGIMFCRKWGKFHLG